jgi:hypothetical protein
MLRSSLPLMKVTGSDYFMSNVVGTCAAVLGRVTPTTAARLLAAVERFQREAGIEGTARDLETQRRTRERLERVMDPVELADASMSGAEMSMDEAADLAYAALGELR